MLAFLVGGMIFYHILNRIFNDRIEEDLRTEKLLIQHEINHFDSMPDYQSVYGHLLQIRLFDHPRKYLERLQDTVMFDMKLEDFRLYRHLRFESTTEDGKGYIVNLFKPLDNRKMLTEDIIFSMTILFADAKATGYFAPLKQHGASDIPNPRDRANSRPHGPQRI